MAKNEIPPEVRRFILTSLPSVPHLEALMLLRATAPAPWSAVELAQRLYVPAAVARDVLTYLARAGMLCCDDLSSSYKYDAQRHAAGGLIDSLARFYSSNLVEITLLIHSKLDRKAQQFANAFNFRKDS
jgi:DNA-binding IclR family transcriptional regulator